MIAITTSNSISVKPRRRNQTMEPVIQTSRYLIEGTIERTRKMNAALTERMTADSGSETANCEDCVIPKGVKPRNSEEAIQTTRNPSGAIRGKECFARRFRSGSIDGIAVAPANQVILRETARAELLARSNTHGLKSPGGTIGRKGPVRMLELRQFRKRISLNEVRPLSRITVGVDWQKAQEASNVVLRRATACATPFSAGRHSDRPLWNLGCKFGFPSPPILDEIDEEPCPSPAAA
jgi:hypothetical protein